MTGAVAACVMTRTPEESGCTWPAAAGLSSAMCAPGAAPGGRRGAIFMDRPGAIAEIAGSTHSPGIAAIWEPATTPRQCAFFSK